MIRFEKRKNVLDKKRYKKSYFLNAVCKLSSSNFPNPFEFHFFNKVLKL